jgi:hypothetical protein
MVDMETSNITTAMLKMMMRMGGGMFTKRYMGWISSFCILGDSVILNMI